MKISIKRVQNDACIGSAEREKFGTQFNKTMRFLSMAALALVGAVMTGCTNDDNFIDEPQQPENKSNVVTLTTTVSMDGGTAEARGTTRALTAGGVKTFAAGETMALVYKNTSSATVKVVSTALTDGDITNAGKSATFTFELTDPDKAQDVTYIYPAAMANNDGTVNYDALSTQNGTLATLSSSLDLATKTGAWTDAGSLPAATLENQLAILAITLKDNATPTANDITSTITGVTLSDGTNSYAITRTAAAGPIYVAIKPTTSANITVTATNGTTNYTKSLTGKTYAVNNGYSVSWRMATSSAPAGLEAVDLGLSVKWANMNVGASSVTDYGKYYAWAATTDNYSSSLNYEWANTPYRSGDSWTKYTGSDYSTLQSGDDAAAVNWGGSWRMPTETEMQELLNNTTRTWQSNYNSSGIAGYLFTSTKTGYTDKSIFLPAAGYRDGSSLSYGGTGGYYWSSTLDTSHVNYGRYLYFYSGNAYMYYGYGRCIGFAVRAVQ